MSKRKLMSNIMLFFFFILVSLTAILSDMFQSPIKSGSQVIDQAKLFTSTELSLVKELTLKNKAGEFIFERNESNQISPWHMKTPRDISANSVYIEKLFTSLSTIKIKKIFPDEKINYSNFSIDKPTSTLILKDDKGRMTNIAIGLMNTIDNSTYLKIQTKPGIYHVEAPSVLLENATILDLIESQIISIDRENITSLRIYRENKKSNSPFFEIKKDNTKWYDSKDNLLSIEKIDEYFNELSSLKSSFIIDKQTDAQKKQINSLTKNASYIVSIEDLKGNTIDYNISSIVRDLSDINLKNEDYFVVTISNNSNSYVVKKEFYELFNKKIDSLRVTK